MRQHVSFPGSGKAAGGHARVRTGLGKSDRPGSKGGLRKRGPWRNEEPTPQPKGRDWSLFSYRCARQCSTRQKLRRLQPGETLISERIIAEYGAAVITGLHDLVAQHLETGQDPPDYAKPIWKR